MDWLEALVLGIVQGLTEWLPVSSSGHLAIVQKFMGGVPILFDILLHLGTMTVLVVFFRKEIRDVLSAARAIVRDVCRGKGWRKAIGKSGQRRLAWFIVIGSVPTAALGILFELALGDLLFSNLQVVLAGFVVTGLLLAVLRMKGETGSGDRRSARSDGTSGGQKDAYRDFRDMRAGDALIIGTAQGIAVLPGFSRSGLTIGTGALAGLSSETAGRYSFLLSIPAVLGALALKLGDIGGLDLAVLTMGLGGMLVAGLVGYVTLAALMRILKKGAIHLFAPYCLGMAALMLFMFPGLF